MSREELSIVSTNEMSLPNKPYFQRFIWNVLDNSWKMLVTQQLFPTLGILIATTLVGIYWGLISNELSNVNLKAVLQIIAITLFVVLLINILRAPSQLDFQQEEIITKLEIQISQLKNQLVTQNQSHISLLTPKPIFYCKNPKIIGIRFEGLNVAHRSEDEGQMFAAVADFYYKNTLNSLGINIRARIVFSSPNVEKVEKVENVKNPMWLEEKEMVKRFEPNDTHTLVIALLSKKQVFLYEHNTIESGMTILMPNRKQIEGKNFQVEVTLVADNNTELVDYDKTFKFNLSIEHEPVLAQLGEQNQ